MVEVMPLARFALNMNKIRRNIVANTLGRGWATFLGVAILPLYMRFLGAEAYGLVSLYTTIAVVCSLFDAGISISVGREIARANSDSTIRQELTEFLRTTEVIYSNIGLFLGALVALCAPLIVTHWLNLKVLSNEEATQAVRMMGVYLAIQWSTGLYVAGLSGLQKQVELNVVTSIASTVRAVGTVVVLWKVSASPVAFYAWQAASTAAYLCAVREVLWRSPDLDRSKAAFRWSVTRRVRSFAAGVTVMSIVSVLISQIDKVVLAAAVPLDAFGYYSLACSVGAAATFFGQPVVGATYPALIEAYVRKDEARLQSLFHRASQLVSVATFVPAAVLCAFAPVVLQLWARDSLIAENASELVSVCVIGAALNAAGVMPYNLALAAGRVRPPLVAATIGVLVYALALSLLTPRIGVMAGAIGGLLSNLTGLILYGKLSVGKILENRARRWASIDVLVPFMTAFGVSWTMRAATAASESIPVQAAGLGLASVVALAATTFVTPTGRLEVLSRVRS